MGRIVDAPERDAIVCQERNKPGGSGGGGAGEDGGVPVGCECENSLGDAAAKAGGGAACYDYGGHYQEGKEWSVKICKTRFHPTRLGGTWITRYYDFTNNKSDIQTSIHNNGNAQAGIRSEIRTVSIGANFTHLTTLGFCRPLLLSLGSFVSIARHELFK